MSDENARWQNRPRPAVKPAAAVATHAEPERSAERKLEVKLLKKLREIDELSAAAAAGRTLEANQRLKLESRATIAAELDRLTVATRA